MSASPSEGAFSKLFHEDTVLLRFEAKNKNEVLASLVDVLVKSGRLASHRRDAVVDAMVARESLGSTGIGAGIAIPHVKTDEVERTITAVGVSAAPVDFKAVDGEPCDLFFLLISPRAQAENHLRVLRWMSKLVRNGDFCRFMRSAHDAQEVVGLFQEMSE